MRLQIFVQDEVEKDAKAIRAAKNAKTKKTLEKFQAIQKDLQQTVSEVSLEMILGAPILFLYIMSNYRSMMAELLYNVSSDLGSIH